MTTTLKALFITFLLFTSQWVLADAIWIDVRSAEENAADHIEGDLNIPHSDIVAEVNKLYPDKNTEITLYCRSGGRAGKAMSALQADGYTKISNAGGIADARKQRGLDK